MTEEQGQELIDLAETLSHYLKALLMRDVPMELAGRLVCDWQRAYIQDEIDRRARGRRSSSPIRHVFPNGTELG